MGTVPRDEFRPSSTFPAGVGLQQRANGEVGNLQHISVYSSVVWRSWLIETVEIRKAIELRTIILGPALFWAKLGSMNDVHRPQVSG